MVSRQARNNGNNNNTQFELRRERERERGRGTVHMTVELERDSPITIINNRRRPHHLCF